MRSRLIIIFSLLSWILVQSLSGQTPEENLDKYWFYRDEFYDKFILDADPYNLPANASEDGTNIPAIVYNSSYNDGWTRSVKWGDSQIAIAHYLSTMATEYKLKQIQSLNTDDVSEKIFRALYAMDRVDFAAEMAFNCNTSVHVCDNYTNINGFFLRDDMTDALLDSWALNGKSSWIAMDAKHAYADPPEHDNLQKREMSEDMVWNLLQGYALVKHLIDDNTQYEDYLCEELTLKEYAKKQTARFIQYMHTHVNNSAWDFCQYNESCYPGEWVGGPLQV